MQPPVQEDYISEEDEDDYYDESPSASKRTQGARPVVMSEVYGEHNKREDFEPKVIEKTEEQKARIIDRLQKAFMFEALDEKETEIVVNAMEER
jgi:cAMP-dependent protein kinase regulator